MEQFDNAMLTEMVEALEAKQGHGITVMDLRGLDNAVCDYFVVCDVENPPHLRSLADEVEHRVASGTGELPWRSSGRENAQWVVLDYFDIVVHIFLRSMREFYDIDSLWKDARVVRYPNE